MGISILPGAWAYRPYGGPRRVAGHTLADRQCAYFPLNEGGGTAVRNLVTGLDGQFVNAPSWTVTRFGPAIDFNGTNDRIDIPDGPEWDNTDQMTWSAWIKPDSVSTQMCFLMKGLYPTSWSYALQTNSTNLRVFITNIVNDPGNNLVDTNDGPLATVGVWYHVVVVFDGGRGGNTTRIRMFVNGIERSEASGGGTIPAALVDSANAFRIGDFVGLGRPFDGSIADVAVFRAALTPTQIRQLYQDPWAALQPPAPFLLRWLKSSGGSSTTNKQLNAVQASVAVLIKAVSRTRAATQATVAFLSKSISTALKTTQAQVATLSALRVILRTLFAVQAQFAVQSRLVAISRVAIQATAAVLRKSPLLARVAVQAQAVIQSRVVSLNRQAMQAQAVVQSRLVAITRIATQAQVATLVAIKVILRTLLATQVAVATLVRSVLISRNITQAQAASQSRRSNVTELATQAQAVIQARFVAVTRVVAQATASTLSAIKVLLRALYATQATTATLSVVRSLLRSLYAVQAASAALLKATSIGIRAQQTAALYQKRDIAATRAAGQAQAVTQTRFIGKFIRAVQSVVARLSTILPGAARPRQLYYTASRRASVTLTATRNVIQTYIASED